MTRKGGNPDLNKFSFKCTISEIPAEQYSIRLPSGSKKALMDKFGNEVADRVRAAIAALLVD
jgi:hypothetical protein